MADIHILTGRDGKLTAVYHVATPVGVNQAAIGWSTALVNSGQVSVSLLKAGDGTSGTISAAEAGLLANGTLLEVVDEVLPDSAPAGAGRLAYLRQLYADRTAEAIALLQARLRFFGFTTTKV